MKEKNKRLHILLSQEEYDHMKQEAQKRNISIAELLRQGFHNEVSGKTPYTRFLSLANLIKLVPLSE
ncbi:MAG: CopG family transcriptional regulator [Spirochaetota bacterium]